MRVFLHGEQVQDKAAAAFCQLARPDPRQPTYIVGVPSPALQRWEFGGCGQLYQQVTTYQEDRMVFNVTPTYSFVDLHIGMVRSWLCWAGSRI